MTDNPFETLKNDFTAQITFLAEKIDSLANDKKKQDLSNEWLTPEEALSFLKISHSTLYRWVKDEKNPLKVYGKKGERRYKKQDLENAWEIINK